MIVAGAACRLINGTTCRRNTKSVTLSGGGSALLAHPPFQAERFSPKERKPDEDFDTGGNDCAPDDAVREC
jgi:hypothetical protein